MSLYIIVMYNGHYVNCNDIQCSLANTIHIYSCNEALHWKIYKYVDVSERERGGRYVY